MSDLLLLLQVVGEKAKNSEMLVGFILAILVMAFIVAAAHGFFPDDPKVVRP